MNMSIIPTDRPELTTNATRIPSLKHPDGTRDLIILVTLAILIIIINGLIALSFISVKKLRQKPANIMICSQACTDLFNGFVYIPNYLIGSETALTLILFMSCYMLCLSLFNLLAISMDRYLALCKPFLHRRYVDVERTHKMVFLVWSAPLIIVLIPLFWFFGDVSTKIQANNIYRGTIWLLVLILVLSMTLLYILATRSARSTIQSRITSLGNQAQDKAATLARKELRVVHLFGLLLFFFAAAYLPILYINFCDMIGMWRLVPPFMEVVSLYLLTMNSVLNPILCILLKKDYLRAIKRIFLRQYGVNTPYTASDQRAGSSVSSQYTAVASSAGSFVGKASISLSERRSTQRKSSISIVEKEKVRAKTYVCEETEEKSVCHVQRCRLYYFLTPVTEEGTKGLSHELRASSI